MEDKLVSQMLREQYHHRDIFSRQVDLAYNINIKKEFGEENEEIVKVVKLKRIEQEEKTIEEFVQEFRKVARKSGYERRPLIKKYKRSMNKTIY